MKGILLWLINIPISIITFFTCSTQSSPFREVGVRRWPRRKRRAGAWISSMRLFMPAEGSVETGSLT